MSQEKQGIKELKELSSFIVSLVQAIVTSLEDGSFSVFDALKFFEALRKAGPAFKDIGQIRVELSDLSEEEKEELRKQIEKDLDLKNDLLEGFIEEVLKGAISLLDLVQAFQVKKEIVKSKLA